MKLLQQIGMIKPIRDFYDHFYVSVKNRYAFHTVGKAANSTIKKIFYELELENTHYASPAVHDRLSSPLLSPFQLDERALSDIFFGRSYYRFTFVRNPFSRLLSCYLDRIQNHKSRPYLELVKAMEKDRGYEPSFGEFIEHICLQKEFRHNNHWRVQTADALCGLIDYDFFGKQEDFLEDVSFVYRRISGRDIGDTQALENASPAITRASDQLSDYWTPDLVKLVQIKYRSDFEVFGYDRELPVS